MDQLDGQVKEAADRIVEAIRYRLKPGRPFLIAIDGASGSGKSSVAAKVTEELDAVLIPGDDFFAAEITDDGWASRSAVDRAADGIDWRRLRSEVLEPLLKGRPASWKAFDFVSGARADGSYGMLANFKYARAASMIVLEGTYAARPELLDLIDLSVLVEVAAPIRHERLRAREEQGFLEAWHARWDKAEEHYFMQVRPASHFDLVVTNTAAAAPPV